MGLLYSRTKVFHYKDKLDSLPRESSVVLPPLHIRIKPTNACVHNCRYCAYRVESLQLGQDMSKRDAIPRDKMIEITQRKNADYTGDTDNPFKNFELVERLEITSTEIGLLTRMTDKLARLISFQQRGKLEVLDESIEDTLIDLGNYSALLGGILKSKSK